ncbi:putative glutathione transferase omega-1 protein [Golovinomyces cichoracearum]|uniref:Putative glutathione transferase omega-1 protein n=1 Tax=Golovinomyces cichoracearum TaxID=62708 RepID=A0A420H989_9PEZI|nr:putative glutathione transferase omega-1 protein [Golovinomyces cichoracearum]
MEGYAPAFIAHNVPLLFVSGVSSASRESHTQQSDKYDAGTTLDVSAEVATKLMQLLNEGDSSTLAWNSNEFTGKKKFRAKPVGRDYTLPPRTAITTSTTKSLSPASSKQILHSILSPLSPESALYPDGLIDSKWIEKHQELVPCVLISFYKFTTDPNFSQTHDDKLKAAICQERKNLSLSGYKSYLVVALINDDATVISPDIEERLSILRKETGLDTKSSQLFLSSQNSIDELKGSVTNLVAKIYPACIEYYRDHSKHSRRKKNRGVVPRPTAPPTSGTSQILSSQVWNFRYDFKLGVFAEFRQEMDSALRSYESAYEILFGADILETISNWSPRWNEARCLADVLAFRMIRCLLWNGKYTSAVRRWALHKERIKDFVDRRGKGSATYGWEAWEARWATIMGEIIKRVSIPEFNSLTIYLLPESSLATGKRLEPWEYLHHPGYWFRIASKHVIARRCLAQKIPEEYRLPPASSPGLRSRSNDYIFDTYMCPEPYKENPLPGNQGFDHSSLILDLLTEAITEFEKRKQIRLVQELQMLTANELIKKKKWPEAFKILLSLQKTMSYRKECWWHAVEEVLLALREVAVYVGEAESILAVDWELMNKDFTRNSDITYDFSNALNCIDLKNRPTLVIQDTELHSFLTSTFTFGSLKGKVGDVCLSQFVVHSNAISSSAPVKVSQIRISFEGNMKSIILNHKDVEIFISNEEGSVSMRKLVLCDTFENGQTVLTASTSLSFHPSCTTVFEFSNYLRECGLAKAVAATYFMSTEKFDLKYINNIHRNKMPGIWWNEDLISKKIARVNTSSIVILQKPPKLELRFKSPHSQYCINESILLELFILNNEDFDTIVALDVHLLGEHAPQVTLEINSVDTNDSGVAEATDDKVELTGVYVGNVLKGKCAHVDINIPPVGFPGKYELLMKGNYRLVSEINNPMLKTVSAELQIINPFEATYDFSPRIHPDPWPSLFNYEEETDDEGDQESRPQSIPQRWCLTVLFSTILNSDIFIEDIKTETISINGEIWYQISKVTEIPKNGLKISPGVHEQFKFEVTAQNLLFNNRATASLDKFLVISWRRNADNSPINHTRLSIPRMYVSSSEPRVFGEIRYDYSSPFSVQLDFMVENLSQHFLSFGLSMESGENFVFSGIKQSVIQLLPLSRKLVKFRILPRVRNMWLGPIKFVVRDRYYQKVLRVMTTEMMKNEKEGIMIWIPGEVDC